MILCLDLRTPFKGAYLTIMISVDNCHKEAASNLCFALLLIHNAQKK